MPQPSEPGSSTPNASGRRPWIWVALIAALIAIAAVAAALSQNSKTDSAAPSSATSTTTQSPESADPSTAEEAEMNDDEGRPAGHPLERRDESDPAGLGDVNAPVVVIEYSDYKCPYCALFSNDTMPLLKSKYIDTGLVRFEWRDFPVLGDQSVEAAVAARAAAEQGLFWEFNESLFSSAPDNGHAEYTRESLTDTAKRVGVPDLDKFAADLDNAELKDLVMKDLQEGISAGLTSTPTFVIDGMAVPGAQPFEVFEQVIDEALAKAEK